MVGIDIPSQEQTRIENRFIADDFKQSSKIHALILPLMANYGNGIDEGYIGNREQGLGSSQQSAIRCQPN
jgi:hypothetical protein